jgi:mono/diheme cytochrome c family protein
MRIAPLRTVDMLGWLIGFFVAIQISVAPRQANAQLGQAHPVVIGFERFFAQPDADQLRGGQLLLGELNCTSCHKADGAQGAALTTKQAPNLDDVARRVKPDYLRSYLANPHAVKPGTTMPELFAGLTEQEKKEKVESLVHYLASLSPGGPEQLFPTFGASLRGKQLFAQVGCLACHASPEAGASPLPNSIPLGNPNEKYTLPSLTEFLIDPLHVRPSGRMPSLNLSSQEARDIASFLLSDLPATANVKYSYYEGSWNSLPDFSKLTPVTVGGTSEIDVGVAKRTDQFGLRFEGFLQIEQDGDYTFHLRSDDGSKLYVDDKLIVDNDGVHPPSDKSGKTRLTKGLHAVVVDFFEQGGGEEVRAQFEGPGVKKQLLGAAMTATKEIPNKDDLKLQTVTVDPALAEQGRKLFASAGCASCHQLKENGQAVASQFAAKSLGNLQTGAGCLSQSPGNGLPRFNLSPQQRTAITAALAALKSPSSRPAAVSEQIDRTLVTFNCYACHQRGEIGGVEEARIGLFTGTTPEMGDEGSIPPSLTGVGAKLTAEWLSGILANGANDRPYMHTRMPKFGAANVGHLTALLEKVDTIEAVAKPAAHEPIDVQKTAGWQMVGDKGFSCIKCHTFGPYKATGIQSIDLTIMTRRLREDWFKRYVRNPQIYRRGTRMPSAWPEIGPSLLTGILDADSDRQIHAVWLYLSDGNKARTPEGLVTGSTELIPFNEAIIYRNFIEGAGPRAIGVGYPEGRHLAFDANNMRLALLWQGAFIDAKRHWTGRGEGFQPPAGANILKLPDSPSFAILPDPEASWPKQPAKELGYQFRGYRLTTDQRPTFLYSFGAVSIEDFPNPIVSQTTTTLRRTLTLKSDQPVENLCFRAAVAAKIEPAEDGWFRIDGTWRMRLQADPSSAPIVRQQPGGAELLLPIRTNGGQATIVQEFSW